MGLVADDDNRSTLKVTFALFPARLVASTTAPTLSARDIKPVTGYPPASVKYASGFGPWPERQPAAECDQDDEITSTVSKMQ